MASFDSILEQAKKYVDWDPNVETKQFVADAIAQGNTAELTTMFTGRLQFGTAGLRAAMGAGYNRMNELVVLQTSQGLAHYLEATVPDAKSKVCHGLQLKENHLSDHLCCATCSRAHLLSHLLSHSLALCLLSYCRVLSSAMIIAACSR
jgi:phosphomannomutase